MQSRAQPRRTKIGNFQITERGNSKGINCMTKLDGNSFPSDLGTEVSVIEVVDDDEVYLEVVPNDE